MARLLATGKRHLDLCAVRVPVGVGIGKFFFAGFLVFIRTTNTTTILLKFSRGNYLAILVDTPTNICIAPGAAAVLVAIRHCPV